MITGILIDQREPPEIQALSFEGTPVVITMLEYGDLQVLCDDGALLVIERKTPGDLLSSVGDGRLLAQIAGCVSVSKWVYLVVDGRYSRSPAGKVMVNQTETGWTWAALRGALLTVQDLGAQVLITESDNFEQTIIYLARRNRGELKITPRRSALIASPAEQVLSALPGIGPDKAEKILANHNGNLTWALCSLLDPDWQHQDGIGPKTKDNLRALFALQANEILWPFENDKPKERTNQP